MGRSFHVRITPLEPTRRTLVDAVAKFLNTLTEIQAGIAADVHVEGPDDPEAEIAWRLQLVVATVRDDLAPGDQARFDGLIRQLSKVLTTSDPA
ncbi:hypothetical protein AB0J14_27625 [Micromonospora arborensis]|uniref:hypothetical protein n=1 Tax=Micromonospora arborensis TaxID=2116518 RepID=UPI00340FCEA4